LSDDATVERVAIPWLHVMREHPMFLAQYTGLVTPRPAREQIGQLARQGAWWARQLTRAARPGNRAWFGPTPGDEPIDVLFVSHLLRPKDAGQQSDSYFRDVPQDLATSGMRVAIAMLNHSGAPEGELVARWSGPVPRFMLSRVGRFADELALLRRLRTSSRALARRSRAASGALDRAVAARASHEAWSPSAATALRMFGQIADLVGRTRPRMIVTTFEGHAWERIAYAAARSVDPRVACVGYQHAMVWRLQHAIRRLLSPRFNPDVVLTSGPASKAQLETALTGIRVDVLGSDRGITGSPKSHSAGGPSHSAEPRTCLVLPEGIPSECNILFDFSLECARLYPDVRFVWRLHPILTFDALTRHNPLLRSLPRNVEVSTLSFEEDLARSQWTLYRGTTAVVRAVGAQVRPVYLALPDEMSIDPLHALHDWKLIVRTPADVRAVLSAPDDHAAMQRAQSYCDALFQPFDIRALKDLLAART
jgi:hypothetical protein